MTAVAEGRLGGLRLARQPAGGLNALGRFAPLVLAALNAIAFLVVRPDVNDLWAARARASAVQNGVGLTYWFSWFGGGSTPGNYSVLTPYLSALITTELLAALSAVAIPLLCMPLLRGTAHPLAGTAIAAYAAAVNLWSGRVPFLFGAAIAIGALICVRNRRLTAAVLLGLLSILASPVTGVFLAMGLSGVFISYRDYRRIAWITIVAIGVGLGAVGLVFGTPGPEPFSGTLKLEAVAGLLLLLLARPPVWLRTTIWVSLIATLVLATFPNGMGSNVARIVWFCLPVAVVALSAFRTWILVLVAFPLLLTGTSGTIVDLRNAGNPVSSVGYYQPLATELDSISGLQKYRVEVVNHGAHAAYDALLNHAALARGWETQEDNELNGAIQGKHLDATTYKVWLENNAVGYVAMPALSVSNDAEYHLVETASLPYLVPIWQTTDWQLFRVVRPTPIVAPPASMVSASQAQVTVAVPCTCAVTVRVRWSKFLHAAERSTNLAASVSDDGAGWTSLRTTAPGVYVLGGSLGGLLGS
ncbi:MAG: hypothetical protein ACR2LF_11180 [Jatrophihabitantaceae bacterium]